MRSKILLFMAAAILAAATACVKNKETADADGARTCADSVRFEPGQEICFADPTIFVEDSTYYMTGTLGDSSKGFVMLASSDLKNWVPVNGGSYILSTGKSVYGDKGFWAPQIYKENGKYYLFYTANEQTVMAQSSSVSGPYRQDSIKPIDGSVKNIDPFLFKDGEKYYLYHVRFNHGNYIWVAEYDMSTGEIDKSTLKQCLDYTAEWEKTDDGKWDPIMEGPTVIKLGNTYYLFYSANHFLNPDYAMGYATAKSATGPWTKYESNPVLHRSIVGENGSGHGDFFYGTDGKPYYVYHVHNSDSVVAPRKTRIAPLVMDIDKKTIKVDSDNIIIPRISL